MHYAIIGTGAIGGYYGGKLAHAGNDVHFLFHSEYETAARRGLRVESPGGDFTVWPIRAYRDTRAMPPCDAVIVALKTTVNAQLPDLLRPVLKPGGLVLLIQNGLGMEEELASALPPDTSVAGGMAFICSNRTGQASVRHLDYGKLTVGLHSGDESLCRRVLADMEAAGIETAWAPDLQEARWRKLVWNIPYNGLCVALNTTTDEIMRYEPSRSLARTLMEEVIGGANANGVAIPLSFADDMLRSTDRMRPYKPSMRLDYDNRRPLEIQSIYTNPLLSARAHGSGMPRVEALERQLRFIEHSYLK